MSTDSTMPAYISCRGIPQQACSFVAIRYAGAYPEPTPYFIMPTGDVSIVDASGRGGQHVGLGDDALDPAAFVNNGEG